MSQSRIEDKLDQFKRQIQQSSNSNLAAQGYTQGSRHEAPHTSQSQKGFTSQERSSQQILSGGKRKNYLYEEEAPAFRDGSEEQKQGGVMKRNPNFGAQAAQPQQTYVSSDDDIPVGFSRRKRLSSHSSFNRKFESNINAGGKAGDANNAPNLVTLSRRDDPIKSQRGDPQYDEQQNIDELNRQIKRAREAEEEDERIHQQTEAMLEQKREQINQRLRDHEQSIRIEKEMQQTEKLRERDRHRERNQGQEPIEEDGHGGSARRQARANRRENQLPAGMAPPGYGVPSYPYLSYDMMQRQSHPLMQPMPYQQQNPLYSQQFQIPSTVGLGNVAPPGQNYFPPVGVANLPQYTNLDIPAHIDQNLQKMKETLAKLKQDNAGLKQELNKKQLLSVDLENNAVSNFDKEKYQQHAQTNLKLKQQVEDMRRREQELKSRLSSLQANKQYLNGRANTLSLDIDVQDRQEDSLNKQISEFNGLVREKESYIKQLMNELNQLKESKEQYSGELQVLAHKEEFLVNELVFKEDQLNEVLMSSEELRRKIQSGHSQSKYLQAENERLKRELLQLREESAVLKASTDFLNNEEMNLNEHISEYEHKLVLSQSTLETLNRQTQQDKQELAHLNSTILQQQRAYEELKNQLQTLNERNARMSMQNEMMMLKQQQQQEQLAVQIEQQQQAMRIREQEMRLREEQRELEKQRRQEALEREIREREAEEREQLRDDNPFANQQQREAHDDTLQLEAEVETQVPSSIKRQRRHQRREQDPVETQQSPEQITKSKNQGSAMASLLSQDEKAEVNAAITRRSMPVQPLKARFQQLHEDKEEGDLRQERKSTSRGRKHSTSRQDQMNGILKWSLDQDEQQIKQAYNTNANRDRGRKQAENQRDSQQEYASQIYEARLLSSERRKQDGKQMQGIFASNGEENTTVEERIVNQRGSMRQRTAKVQEINLDGRGQSPVDLRNEIKDRHYGGNMANLLAFEAPEESILASPQKPGRRNTVDQKPNTAQLSASRRHQKQEQNTGANIFGMDNRISNATKEQNTLSKGDRNSNSTAKLGGVKKVGIDLSHVEQQRNTIGSTLATPTQSSFSRSQTQKLSSPGQATINLASSHPNDLKQKRKEELDRTLLQMQIEQDKMRVELQKIGDFPKTTQQIRRKKELTQELGVLNTTITDLRQKIKSLRA